MENQSQTKVLPVEATRNRYGLLTMLSMIVGIVIGSGIFFVNESAYAKSDSAGLTMIAWLVISLIVLFMAISFIEISSITKINKKSGTLNNWFGSLWSQEQSKYIGFFFALVYFPVLISGFAVLSGDQFLYFVRGGESGDNVWLDFVLITIIGLIAISIIYGMNIFTSKPSKHMQVGGTIVKITPLVLLVFFGFLAVAGAMSNSSQSEIDQIFDSTSDINGGWDSNDSWSAFKTVILLSPTIMFSYDGFLFAASLQSESKKPSTFKVSLLSGIVFIILIYILTSIFVFSFGQGGEGLTVPEALGQIFPEQEWIVPLMYLFIFISLIVSISGCSIAQNRMVADLSVNNHIPDANGNYVKRNNASVPQNAAILSFVVTLSVFFIFRLLDATLIFAGSASSYSASGIGMNMTALFSFTFYTIIIIGAIMNRFTKKVEVEKVPGFLIVSAIAVIFMAITILIYAVDLFAYDNNGQAGYNAYYTINIIVPLLMLTATILFPVLFSRKTRKYTKEQMLKKEELIVAYNEQKAYSGLKSIADYSKEYVVITRNIFDWIFSQFKFAYYWTMSKTISFYNWIVKKIKELYYWIFRKN